MKVDRFFIFRYTVFVITTLDEATLSAIWETEEDKELSIGDLKKKYLTFAKNRFIRAPPQAVINKDTSWSIALSGRVISEWRTKSRTRERVLSIQLLDIMIEGAVFLETVRDTKNSEIENVSYFENACKINGKLFKINITIKKQKVSGRRFAYYYSATGFEVAE